MCVGGFVTDQPWDDGARGLEALAVVVERYVTVKGGELEGAVGRHGHHLGRVEDQADIVEGGGDEAAGRDVALAVLELEGGFEGQAGEEGPNGGHEEFELGREGIVDVVLVGDWVEGPSVSLFGVCGEGGCQEIAGLTVVVDHYFDIAEDLAVPPMGLIAGLGYTAQALSVEGAMGLGIQHKGHGQ